MAIPVLIIGKSGSGKSTSMEKCAGLQDWNLIRVLNKPLPFKGTINGWHTDDYQEVMKCLAASTAKSIVIDDAGYLLTNQFMKGHSNNGLGNQIFSFYNQIGDHFWNLIQFITEVLPKDKIIYMMMHEDKDEFGEVKPKTIGKMLDEKVCVEGMFTIVLRAVKKNNKHVFITQAEDGAVSKSPKSMFESLEIDNDLLFVDNTIRNYYELKDEKKGDKR